MATRLTRSPDLYAEDFRAWAEAQMAALRRNAGQLPAEIDAEHLIEELDMAVVATAPPRAARSRASWSTC